MYITWIDCLVCIVALHPSQQFYVMSDVYWVETVLSSEVIRIYHECEDGIEKSVWRISVCHHSARFVMTNGDREGRIFLSHPHRILGSFSY